MADGTFVEIETSDSPFTENRSVPALVDLILPTYHVSAAVEIEEFDVVHVPEEQDSNLNTASEVPVSNLMAMRLVTATPPKFSNNPIPTLTEVMEVGIRKINFISKVIVSHLPSSVLSWAAVSSLELAPVVCRTIP